MRMTQKIILLLIMGLASVGAAFAEDQPLNRVVAIVNEGVITQVQLDKAVAQTEAQANLSGMTLPSKDIVEKKVLDKLIVETIALQLAKLNHISVTDQELKTEIANVAKGNGVDLDKLKQMLASQHINFKDYQEMMRKKLIIRKLEQSAVAGSIQINQQEVDAVMKQMAAQGKEQTEYTIGHILISVGDDPTPESIAAAKKKASLVMAKLKMGLDFNKAAEKYSDASDSLQGGVIKDKTLAEIPTLYVSEIKHMKVGELAGPIKAGNGYHIIKLIDEHKPSEQTHFVTQYRVNLIMVKTSPILSANKAKTLLLSLRNAIQNGASFSSVAKANSQADTASQGGDMGWVTTGQLPAGVGDEVQMMKKGELSKPFNVGDEWYLVQMNGERQKDNTKNYKETMARRVIFQRKAVKAVQAWQSKIKAESYVKVLLGEAEKPAS